MAAWIIKNGDCLKLLVLLLTVPTALPFTPIFSVSCHINALKHWRGVLTPSIIFVGNRLGNPTFDAKKSFVISS